MLSLDDVDSLAFGVRKTTTKLPVNNNNSTNKDKDSKVPNLATQSPVSEESVESEEEIQSTTSASNIGNYLHLKIIIKIISDLDLIIQTASGATMAPGVLALHPATKDFKQGTYINLNL